MNETSCAFDFDQAYVNNMYIDSSCPKVTADVADAALKIFEESNPNWKDLGTLVKRVSMPITSCLAGIETERTLRRSSVSCTRSLQAANGSRAAYEDALFAFAKKTHEQAIDNAKLSDDKSSWNMQAAAAAVAMFGSPEKFAQEITNFNTNILNNDVITGNSQAWTESKEFLQKIDQFQSRNMNEDKSTSKSGGGGFFGLFGSSNESTNSKKSLEEKFKLLQDTAKVDRACLMKSEFDKSQLSHEVLDVNGSLKFYPRVTFNVKADKDSIKKAAQALSTAELGEIVTETDTFGAEFGIRKEYALQGILDCGAKQIAFSKGIQEVEWWSSRTWFESLSLELTGKIPADGCATVALTFWHDAPADSSAVPESARNVNVSAFAQAQGGPSDYDIMPLGPQTRDSDKSISKPLTATGGPTKRIALAP